MTSLYQPITLIQEYYYISNDLTKLLPVLGFDLKACAGKNRFKIVEKSRENMRYRFTKINVANGRPIVKTRL